MKNERNFTVNGGGVHIEPADINAALEALFKEANKHISSPKIKEQVQEIYYSDALSNEEKVLQIQNKIDEAETSGFCKGVRIAVAVGTAIWAIVQCLGGGKRN